MRAFLDVAQNGKSFAFLRDDEVRTIPRGLITGKGMAQVTLLSESGLYKFILRSDKPQARPFQDWVTREVLPSVRKTGGYILGEEKVATSEVSEDARSASACVSFRIGLRASSGKITRAIVAASCGNGNSPYRLLTFWSACPVK